MDNYKVTFKTWDKIASIYQDKFMDLDFYNETYDLFCANVKNEHSKILEIGCGPGNITKYIQSKRPDFKILAIDNSPNMVALAKKNNPKVDFKIMDCRDIEKISNKFDAVICGFCMPYLSKEDCSKFIFDSGQLLEKEGFFYFSTIEGAYNKSGFEIGSTGDKCFVYYYQEDFLRNLLKENNFIIVKVLKIEYLKSVGNIEVHLIFLARKI